MKFEACITYETITPESAEDGDTADHGYYMPGGWTHSMAEDHDAVLAEARVGGYNLPLGQALREAVDLGVFEGQRDHNGLSCRSTDADVDYQTGEQTYYTLHVSGVTNSTRDRIIAYLVSEGATFT